MKVSVIIPVYNVQPYLERCVYSVLGQSYKDLEIILVDDGSTDESGKMCDQFAEHDSRICVIHQQNQGICGARNTGIRNAKGDYVVFIDSDDLWLLDDGLETIMSSCDDTTDLICFKVVDLWKGERKSYSKDYDLETISKIPNAKDLFEYLIKNQALRLTTWIAVVRRQILIEHQVYFPSRRVGEDFYWHMHLWQHVRVVKMVNIDMYGYWHRQGSITTATVSIRPYQDYDKTFTYWKEQYEQGCINGEVILGYMANIWINRGYRFYRLKSADKPLALEILHKHADLLDYAATPKAKRTAKLYRMVGLRATVFLLGVYWRIRSRIKGNSVH